MTLSEMLDRLHAPDWVRRCVGLNHVVSHRRALGDVADDWFCRTCGKDRP